MEEQEKNYFLKLTIPQFWAAIVVAGGLFGTIYLAGVRTEGEVKKVELLKQEQKFLDEIGLINVSLRKAEDDADYFKDRYLVTKERLTNCIDDKNSMQLGEHKSGKN